MMPPVFWLVSASKMRQQRCSSAWCRRSLVKSEQGQDHDNEKGVKMLSSSGGMEEVNEEDDIVVRPHTPESKSM